MFVIEILLFTFLNDTNIIFKNGKNDFFLEKLKIIALHVDKN